MIFGKKQRCFSLFCQLLGLIEQGGIYSYVLLHVRNAATEQQIFPTHRGKTISRKCLKIMYRRLGNPRRFGMLHNCFGQRMFTRTLQICSKLHEITLRVAFCR